jgi:hypothetical protein
MGRDAIRSEIQRRKPVAGGVGFAGGSARVPAVGITSVAGGDGGRGSFQSAI